MHWYADVNTHTYVCVNMPRGRRYQAQLQPNAKAGAVSGGFARTGSAAGAPGGYKRMYSSEEFAKPKKFKT